MEIRRPTCLALAILLHTLVRTSSATASFPAIQPIVGFSSACTLAYNTPVSLCDIDDFRGVGGKGSCSADCQASLIASQVFVQRLCAGQQAVSNSVIGHLFSGDIVNFLCGNDDTAATTAATTQASTAATQSATRATTQPATSMATGSASTTTKASTSASSTTIASESGTSLTTSTSSKSTKASSSTSSSIPTSIESATSSSPSGSSSATSSSASTTSTSNSQGSGGGGSGGGSPFDGTFTASASHQPLQLEMLTLSCIVALVLAVSWGT